MSEKNSKIIILMKSIKLLVKLGNCIILDNRTDACNGKFWLSDSTHKVDANAADMSAKYLFVVVYISALINNIKTR